MKFAQVIINTDNPVKFSDLNPNEVFVDGEVNDSEFFRVRPCWQDEEYDNAVNLSDFDYLHFASDHIVCRVKFGMANGILEE